MSESFPPTAIDLLLVTDQSLVVWNIKDLLLQINLRNRLHTVGCNPAVVILLRNLDTLRNLEPYTDALDPGLILVGPDCQQKHGFRIVDAIKTDPVLQETPVILFSKAYDKQTLTDFQGQADSVITRPDRARKLLAAIKRFEYLSIVSVTDTRHDKTENYSIIVRNHVFADACKAN